MKKRYSSAILLIILMLILLSIPAAMVLFYRSEFENYEISEVDRRLANIQNHVRLFYEQTDADEQHIIKSLSSYMIRHSESGALIILDEDYGIVFPEDSSSREAREALAEEFAGAIQEGTLRNNSYFDTGDGKTLRITLDSLRGKDTGALYAVAYFDTDNSYAQIDRLETIYLQIAVFSVLMLLFVIVLLYWNYYRYMQLLSEEILRIAVGDFAPIAVPPSFGASERVRRAINTAQEQLRLIVSRRETLERSVHHFVGNHLMAVDGYAQGIEMGVFSPEEAAAKIRMENTVMEELLHNMSVRSFIREQTIPANDEILCLPDEIEASLHKYRYIADQKKISLSLLPGGEASVRGTKGLMETVLDNLISNAIRYAASRVTVSIEKTDDHISVRVADDGKGIGEKEKPYLFQPMFKGSKGNIGIGLSVALDAAKYMGGSLEAENGPDGGAVFIFTLPSL